MREVALEFDFRGPDARPGDFSFRTTESAAGQTYLLLWHILPDGSVGAIPIEPIPIAARPTWTHGDPPKCHTWQWDGNRERPTLTPSVHAPGRWHGWIRGGRMVSC